MASTAFSSSSTKQLMESKITQEFDYIESLFPKQKIKNMNLLYRAS
jgi:hypothetical protein